MDYLELADIRKLAIRVQCERANVDVGTKLFYAWMNDSLMQQYSKGKEAFVKRMNQLISRAPKIRFPYGGF